jgi:2-methylisocitrate lyase-like PEP mutase family enzyme
LLGKQVVSREEFVTRIRAAVLARDQIPGGSDFVIIGRTDSAQVLGMDEAIARLKLASDAGADVCFIEGVKTKQLLERTVSALAPKPVRLPCLPYGRTNSTLPQVLVNVISGGLTPSFTSQDAEDMGAKIISTSVIQEILRVSHHIFTVFSLVSCVPMLHAVREAMKSLRETGTDFSSAQGMGPREFFEAVGLRDVVELDSKAGGVAFASI